MTLKHESSDLKNDFWLLVLGLDISVANWCVGVGDGSLLSFFFYFRDLWFGLSLSFDWSFPLRVFFLSQFYFCAAYIQ